MKDKGKGVCLLTGIQSDDLSDFVRFFSDGLFRGARNPIGLPKYHERRIQNPHEVLAGYEPS